MRLTTWLPASPPIAPIAPTRSATTISVEATRPRCSASKRRAPEGEQGLNLGPLNSENLTRWLDKNQRELSAKDFVFTQAVDQVRSKDPFLPNGEKSRSDIRFVHETRVVNEGRLPEVGDEVMVGFENDDKSRPVVLGESKPLVRRKSDKAAA